MRRRPAQPQEFAYLTRVDLSAVSANLRKVGIDVSPVGAADWLTQPKAGERASGEPEVDLAPFARTAEWSVFYSAEDPETFLYDNEIVTIRDVPRDPDFEIEAYRRAVKRLVEAGHRRAAKRTGQPLLRA
jgi:hypothetical protein